mgnify:CR=1 FL=1
MNVVILIGRLTKDVELRYTQAGKAVATFTLAVDRPFTNQAGERETDFIPVVVWGKLAEHFANYLGKCRQTAVVGRMQIRSYEDQKGQRRRITEVVANSVQFLDWAKESGDAKKEPGEINLDDLPF